MYWFFANEYTSLTAKREIPYNIYQAAAESDLVVIELVERNLKGLLQHTPIIASWNLGGDYFDNIELDSKQVLDVDFYVNTTADGLMQISGSDDFLEDYSYIYVRIKHMEASDKTEQDDSYKDGADESVVYQLLLGEGGDFTFYLEQADADILKADDGSSEYSFILKNSDGYVEIPINVTLQD